MRVISADYNKKEEAEDDYNPSYDQYFEPVQIEEPKDIEPPEEEEKEDHVQNPEQCQTGGFAAVEAPHIGQHSVPLTGLPVPALSLPAPLVPGSLLGAQGLLDDAYRKLRLDYPVPSLFGGDPALAYYTAVSIAPSTIFFSVV